MKQWIVLLAALGVFGCADVVSLGDNLRDAAPVDARAATPDVAASRSAFCDAITRGRIIATGVDDMQFDTTPARLPDTACSVGRQGEYVVTRVVLRARARLRIDHANVRSMAIRRACDDAASEVACVRSASTSALWLDAGTYDLLGEPLGGGPLYPSFRVALEAVEVSSPDRDDRTCAGAVDLTALLPNFRVDLRVGTTRRAGCLATDTSEAMYYRATVPPGRRLVVTAASASLGPPTQPVENAHAVAPTVRIVSSCDAATCLASADAPIGLAATAAWSNPEARPIDVTVVVAAGTSRHRDEVKLSWALTEPPGARCDDATMLPLDTDTLVDVPGASETVSACGDEQRPTTPVRYFRVRVAASSSLTVIGSAWSSTQRTQPWLRLFDACGATECLGDRAVSQAWSGTGSLWFANTATTARDLVLAVGAQVARTGDPPEPISVLASVQPLAAGFGCVAPLAYVPGGAPIALAVEGSPYADLHCVAPVTYHGRYLRVAIPPQSQVELRGALATAPQVFSWMVEVASCPLQCHDAGHNANPLVLSNNTAAPRDALVFVGAVTLDSTGRYRLTSTVRPIPDTARCENPARATDGFSALPSEGVSVATAPCNLDPAMRFTSFQGVTAPSGHTLRVATDAEVDSIFAVGGCERETCAPPDDTSSEGWMDIPFRSWWTANPTAARELHLAAASTPGRAPHVFVTTSPIAPNGSCATATRIEPGQTLRDRDAAGGGSGDRFGLPPGVYYRVTVPPHRALAVSVRRPDAVHAPWWALARLATSCVTPSLRGNERFWSNRTDLPRDLLISVEGAAHLDAHFDLATTLFDTEREFECDSPTTLTNGLTLRDLVLPGPLFPSMSPPTNSGTMSFLATVPAGQSLSITSTAAVGMFRSGGCDTRDSLEALPGTAHGGYFFNDGLSPQRVVLQARATTASPVTTTLHVTIGPPPYVTSRVEGDCDTLSGGALAHAASTSTAVTPLPFPFRYFGETVTGYSASTQGFLQLWPGTSGTPDDATHVRLGDALPQPDVPPRTVAPLWMDGVPAGPDAGVYAAVVATPRRHLTVEWRAMQPCCFATAVDPTTVQAKLFEDGTVEFHYCDLARSQLAERVTIGLQDAVGSAAVAWSPTDPRNAAIRPGDALRFTPR